MKSCYQTERETSLSKMISQIMNINIFVVVVGFVVVVVTRSFCSCSYVIVYAQ